jgi:hypothetical protein
MLCSQGKWVHVSLHQALAACLTKSISAVLPGLLLQRRSRVGGCAAVCLAAAKCDLSNDIISAFCPAGLSLAIAIALHNVPEGVGVALPIYFATGSRLKGLQAAALSGEHATYRHFKSTKSVPFTCALVNSPAVGWNVGYDCRLLHVDACSKQYGALLVC